MRCKPTNLEIFSTHKTAVGFSEQGYIFENSEIDIQKNDSIYLFTDGYSDQFGGLNDKKLTTKRFKELLSSIQHLDMLEQGIEMERYIASWANGRQQVDDMLVIGIKV